MHAINPPLYITTFPPKNPFAKAFPIFWAISEIFLNNGYLYAFFGKYKNGDYPCTIERLNINNNNENNKPAWEMIVFSNPDNIDVRIYGSAILEYFGMLYFFSGKVNEITTDNIFYYNFEQRIILLEESKTDFRDYFRENRLYQIGQINVQCSNDKYFGAYINIKEED